MALISGADVFMPAFEGRKEGSGFIYISAFIEVPYTQGAQVRATEWQF